MKSSAIKLRGQVRAQHGLSLIELMIGMTLGLLVLAAVLYVFAGNRASYRHQESLSLVQESGRFALEILARDIREAGFAGCGHGVTLRDIGNPIQPANFDGLINVVVGATANDPDSFTIQRATAGSDLRRVTAWTGDSLTVDDVVGLAPGTALLLTDCVSAQRLVVRSVAVNVVTVNDENDNIVANPLIGWTGASSFMTVLPVAALNYNVNVATNELIRAGQPIAAGVINMKVLYGEDTAASPYNHDVTDYVVNPGDLGDVVAMRLLRLTVGDGVGANRVELNFPTTMTMRNRVADRP